MFTPITPTLMVFLVAIAIAVANADCVGRSTPGAKNYFNIAESETTIGISPFRSSSPDKLAIQGYVEFYPSAGASYDTSGYIEVDIWDWPDCHRTIPMNVAQCENNGGRVSCDNIIAKLFGFISACHNPVNSTSLPEGTELPGCLTLRDAHASYIEDYTYQVHG